MSLGSYHQLNILQFNKFSVLTKFKMSEGGRLLYYNFYKIVAVTFQNGHDYTIFSVCFVLNPKYGLYLVYEKLYCLPKK